MNGNIKYDKIKEFENFRLFELSKFKEVSIVYEVFK